jgi:hypothetical protein
MTQLDDLRLTSQELTYLATGARLLAEQALADAEHQDSVSVRGIFAGAGRVYHRCGANAAPPVAA